CDPATCLPGEPMEETCNLLDDDCDADLDEGVECPGGDVCQLGQCIAPGEATSGDDASGEDPSGTGGGDETGTSGGSSAAGGDSGGCSLTPGLAWWWLGLLLLGRRRQRARGMLPVA
ncbi:MAG TPA: hypothetical protein VFG69_19670, partial [Nannocystaceae bacterium]|nr:hypothetical protein [Nannocystaceae bacterium]